jgi:RimJ/RimL family protein N-acetyltransferase
MEFPRDVPTLTSGPVTLRAARSEDAAGVVEQCQDPLSIRWTTVPVGYTHENAVDFLTRRIPEGWRSGSAWTYVVEVAGDDGVPRFAGTISLRDEGDRRAEVAYGAHPRARGRGAMVTAVRLLLEWGFAELGLRTVVWWANTGNWASRKLAWRLGFRFGGELQQWLPQRGELVDGWVGTLRAGDLMEPLHPWFDPPRIVGDRVVLRPHEPRDVARMVEGAADPVLKRWLGQFPQPYRAEHAEEFMTTSLERQAGGEGLDWTVADPGTDQFVGGIGLFRVEHGYEAEVGYWLHPSGRGRGVATEALQLALRHAFAPPDVGGMGLARVRAIAAVGNEASRRVLERAGMSHQGRARRVCTLAGGVKGDGLVYDVLAEELGPLRRH